MKLGYFFWYMWINNLPMENGINTESVRYVKFRFDTYEVCPWESISDPTADNQWAKKKNDTVHQLIMHTCAGWW